MTIGVELPHQRHRTTLKCHCNDLARVAIANVAVHKAMMKANDVLIRVKKIVTLNFQLTKTPLNQLV